MDKHQVGGQHYSTMPIQPLDYIVANDLDYLSGNVIKYVSRHSRKGGIEDIDKALHYLIKIAQSEYGIDPKELETIKALEEK